MLEKQIDQHERRATLRQDLSLRQQQEERRRVFTDDQSIPREASTYFQHAVTDAQTPRGRFSAVETSYVVGSKPDISSAYPAAAAAHQIQLPDEPPLGLDNPALDPGPLSLPPPVAQALPNPAPADATSSSDDYDDERRDAGLGLSCDPAGSNVNAGSLPTFRRRV
jgi:hypothetical protein